MLPSKNDIKISASSHVHHSTLLKPVWTFNQAAEFIFHTRPEDTKPEVVIFFDCNSIQRGESVYLYNRSSTPALAERLIGIKLAISKDGLNWVPVEMELEEKQIYNRAPIEVKMLGMPYLKIYRDVQGSPIHLSQITIGSALKDGASVHENLTRAFASKHKLPIDSSGKIIDNLDRDQFIYIRSVLPDSLDVIDDVQVTALEITEFSRFSNAIIQLCNALKIAKKLDAKTVYLPRGRRTRSMFSSGLPFECKESQIVLRVSDDFPNSFSDTRLVGRFFYTGKYKNLVGPSENVDIAKQFRGGLGFDYGEEGAIPENELVIHLRSGDIFDRNKLPHPGYGQPPLAYYKRVIAHVNPEKVHLVYEDKGNPVIDALEAYLMENCIPFTLQSSSLREDIQKLLNARTLVAGMGTFIPGLVWLSSNIRTVHSFHRRLSVPIDARNIIWEDKDGHYFSAILSGNWQNSEEQRRLMLEYPTSSIHIGVTEKQESLSVSASSSN